MLRRKTAAFARPPRKRLVSDREVREELEAALASLPESTPEQIAEAEKEHARFDRWWDRGRAKWDALTAHERQREADRMLANIRRRDLDADDRDLGPDGGREMFGMLVALDREEARRAKKAAKHPRPDLYAAHAAAIARAATPMAERPAPAPEQAPVPDELAERRKRPARRRAGLVAVIDPRLYDIDEEDWT